MTEAQAEKTIFNPFDLTKVWPHGDFPLIDVGVLELNRNPENYFAEVEQAALSPSNIVPGIGFSPDKMLQGRLFAYPDAHRYRIGVNYQHLPVNRPQVATNNYHRDGSMRFDGNEGRHDNYEPNGFGGPVQDAQYNEPPLNLSGPLDRYDAHKDNDNYTQAGNLFRLFDEDEKARLTANIAGTMKGLPEDLQRKNIAHFTKCDPDYGKRIANNLGLKI